MSTTRKSGWGRLIAGAALLGAAIAVLELGHPSEPSADSARLATEATSCKGTSRPASELGRNKVRKQVRCLVNEERAARGARALDRNKSLRVASQRHTKAMVESDCLAHRCGDEPDLETRLRRAGYFEGARSWRYAESTGCGPSTQAMVANWMATRYHRANILEPAYREIGVGVAQEPVATRCAADFATFAVVFGRRQTGS